MEFDTFYEQTGQCDISDIIKTPAFIWIDESCGGIYVEANMCSESVDERPNDVLFLVRDRLEGSEREFVDAV